MASRPSVALGDLAISAQYGTSQKANDRGAGIPVLRMGNVTPRGALDCGDLKHVELCASEFEKHSLRPGDILFNRTNSKELVGKTGMWDGRFEAVPASYFIRLRLNEQRVDPAFVVGYMNSPRMKRRLLGMARGAIGQANINAKELKSIEIPLPPLEEQRRIVDVLNRAASVERLRARADAALRAFAPALFIRMFGDPLENPMGWEVRPLGECTSEFRYGTSQKCRQDAQPGDTPILRIPNVIGGAVNWGDIKHTALTQKERDKLSLYVGDILFVRTNGNPDYIGRCAVYEGDEKHAAFASYLIRARLDPAAALIPAYVHAALSNSSFRGVILKLARTTAGNYNINIESLGSLAIPVPPLPLQTRYAELVATARGVAATAETATTAAASLSAALMSRLFEDAA